MTAGLILTTAGANEIEAAYQAGKTVKITVCSIGDGCGSAVTVDPSATALKGRFGQVPLSAGESFDGMIGGTAIIPCADYPGRVVREFGLESESGTLIAYGAYPETHLPSQSDGVIKELTVRFAMPLVHAENVTLIVDPNIAIITQEDGDKRYYRRSLRMKEVRDEGAGAQQELRENIGCGTAATYDAEDFLPSDYKPPASGVSSVNGKTGAVQLGAVDVGAVAVTGGTMTGELVINVDDGAIRLKTKSTSAASFIKCTDSANANHWYIGAGSKYATDTTFQNNKGGNNSIILKGDGAVAVNPMNGKAATVNGTLQVGTTGSAVLNIGDADSGLRNARDGQIDLWANNKLVGSWNGTAFSFTGQIIPTDYANFDARYGSGETKTGTNNAYYTHANGIVFMQAVRSITVGNDTTVTVTLPTSFPNGIIGVAASFYGNGGRDQDSYYLCTPAGKNQVTINTHNCNGTFSLIVSGY